MRSGEWHRLEMWVRSDAEPSLTGDTPMHLAAAVRGVLYPDADMDADGVAFYPSEST